MKKILSILTLCALLFAACKKSPDTSPEGQRTGVTFTMSDFTESEAKASPSISAVGDTLKNYANNLYYRLYDASGALVKFKSQVSTDAGFGTITDSLSQGSYTVVFVASKNLLGFANTSLESDHFLDPSNTHWDDIFLKKLSIKVGATPVSQSVRLERIVAGLQLNLEPDPEGRFPVINITVDTDDSIYQLNNLTGASPVVKSRQWTIFFGSNTKSVLMYVLNTNRPAKVTIRAYDRVSVLAAEKTIENVRFYPNKKTVFSGRITKDVDMNVSVDPVWYVREPIEF